MTAVYSFAPIEDRNARILILGSMPGAASLAAQQYYAHPRNAFWTLICDITGVAVDAPYAARCVGLQRSGIALWDVLQSCVRPGSLDADIDEATAIPNDFAGFLRRHPDIRHVFFNGSKAADSFRRRVQPEIAAAHPALRYTRLPSTSPANASYSLSRKQAAWQAIRTALADRP